jgi:hypothetical protein
MLLLSSCPGFCVKTLLVPQFLQTLAPQLYTKNALIQPKNPDTQPLYQGDGRTVTVGDYQGAGVGGQYGSAPGTHASVVAVVIAVAVAVFGARL